MSGVLRIPWNACIISRNGGFVIGDEFDGLRDEW